MPFFIQSVEPVRELVVVTDRLRKQCIHNHVMWRIGGEFKEDLVLRGYNMVYSPHLVCSVIKPGEITSMSFARCELWTIPSYLISTLDWYNGTNKDITKRERIQLENKDWAWVWIASKSFK